ncbi:MAG: hypothetical protein ABH886_07880 [Candidatus Desantisbacteria bacterium]
MQGKKTVEEHFLNEQRLKDKGIKAHFKKFEDVECRQVASVSDLD